MDEAPTAASNYTHHFEDEVVFLTGATGSLGGCLLYKLALRLSTKKIYALCRGSVAQAVRKWESSMPQQIDDILDSSKVELITGDLSKPGLGLDPVIRKKMGDEVTSVINTAANISLVESLEKSVRDNCQTAVALFEMVSEFRHVHHFVHFSSLAVNSFLPGGLVEERLYPSPASTTEADNLAGLPGGDASTLPPDERYAWPYGQAKHLAERILLGRSSSIPVLIIRPSAIGPAIAEPFALYGPDKAIPMHTLLLCFSMSDLYRVGATDHFFEEVPVDLVANCCLLHLANKSTGVVHCASPLYVTQTAAEVMSTARKCISDAELAEVFRKQRASSALLWQNRYNLENIGQTPNWHIQCTRSEYQKAITGSLALAPPEHDPKLHLQRRIRRMYRVLLVGESSD
ncbi:male sterility protein-domain-containing protein [Aspergillus karnatakaensis]|uniref:male sterility protein-domain-containing protein n=1 Tax=Aspergillus karnatakaensis TaxID=1810916 RepID=UPI003CCDE85D